MTDRTEACPRCGAHNASTADWCGQCYLPLATRRGAAEDPTAAAVEEEGRRPAHAGAPVGYQGRPIYSRWRAGETSFGPIGRIVMTLLVVAVGVGLGFNYSPAPVVVWVFLVMPILLRQIWKKTLIGYSQTDIPQAEAEPDGEPVP